MASTLIVASRAPRRVARENDPASAVRWITQLARRTAGTHRAETYRAPDGVETCATLGLCNRCAVAGDGGPSRAVSVVVRARGILYRRLVCGVVGAALLTLVACGADTRSASTSRPTLIVSAAASLKPAFTAYARRFPDASVRFSFAGSDELATQIEQGLRPDVYAAANTALPERLHHEGRVAEPTVFAANRLVLAVPAGERDVRALADLERARVKLAIGAATVPVGSYTRALLRRLEPASRRAILASVRSEEPDVAGIIGKLTQGAVDAGFVYASDVRAARGTLRAIELPARLRPTVAYAGAVVAGAEHPALARAFIAGLVSGAGRRALLDAGFDLPRSR